MNLPAAAASQLLLVEDDVEALCAGCSHPEHSVSLPCGALVEARRPMPYGLACIERSLCPCIGTAPPASVEVH